MAELQRLSVRLPALNVARRYSTSLALRALAMGGSSVAAIITARALHPDDRGLLALLAVPVNYVAGFAGTGMRQPFAKAARSDRSSPAAVGTMLIAASIGLAAATAWGVARTAPQAGLAAGGLCVCMVLFAFLEAIALDPQQINRVLKGQVAVQLVFIAGVPLLYSMGAARPLPIIAVQCAAIMSASALFYRGEVRSLLVRPRFSADSLARSLKHAAGTTAVMVLCRIDVLAAVLVLPQALLGQYVVASAFGEFMSQLPAFAGFLVFAETPRDVTNRRKRATVLLVRSLLFSSVVAVVLAFVVPPLLRVLVGTRYDPAARLFVWLLPSYVVASGLRVVAGFLAATAENALLVRISVLGAVTMGALVLGVGVSTVSPIAIGLCATVAEVAAAAVLLLSLHVESRYE